MNKNISLLQPIISFLSKNNKISIKSQCHHDNILKQRVALSPFQKLFANQAKPHND
jgi:hypothetical protein